MMGKLLSHALLGLTLLAGWRASAGILVYKASVSGEGFTLKADQTVETRDKVKFRGYLVVSYEPETDAYSSPQLLKYWKEDKNQYYVIDDFITGIAQFEKQALTDRDYLAVYGFYGGINGEYNFGRITSQSGKRLGFSNDIFIAKKLQGYATWDYTLESGDLTEGKARTTYMLDTKITKTVNNASLDVDESIDYIINEKLEKYTKRDAEKIVTNDPIFNNVDIQSGTINGVEIGGTTPAKGTFTEVQVGADGADGQLSLYSDQGDADYTLTLKPNAAMTQDVTLTFPPDDGDANQLLATDGSGNLSWTTASSVGGEDNTASNVGAGGVGLFLQKSGVDLQFKSVNAGSTKITVTDDTTNNEVKIDVNDAALSVASSQVTDFTEGAQDAVGASLTDSTSVDFTYDDDNARITAAAKVDNSTIEINASNGLQLKDGGVTAAKIAVGTITDTQISNSAAISFSKLTGNLAVSQLPAGGSWALSSNLDLDSGTLLVDPTNNYVGIADGTPSSPLTVGGNLSQSASGTNGDIGETHQFLLFTQTTNNTPTELLINGSDRMVLKANSAWAYKVYIVAKESAATNSAGWKVEGIVRRGSSTVSLFGQSTSNVGDANPWGLGNPSVDIDNTNHALTIKVTGANSTTLNWAARVEAIVANDI